MPIFEYVCSTCGHDFELFVRNRADESKGLCPACESQQIQKRFSTFACCSRDSANTAVSMPAPACTGPV